MPTTPKNVLLVPSFGINGERNDSRRLIRSVQPTVGKYDMKVLPSLESLQFLSKLQSLRYSDYIQVLIRPNFPVTGDGDCLADYEEAKIFDGGHGTQVILDAGIILKDLHPPLVDDNVRGLINL
jgi:hypothetical protein